MKHDVFLCDNETRCTTDNLTMTRKKRSATLRSVLKAAARSCNVVEGIPSCATCEHAHPVPEHEGGAERNIYCWAVDYFKHPNGLMRRRTEHCAMYRPNAITVKSDLMPILRKRFRSRAEEIMRKMYSTTEGEA